MQAGRFAALERRGLWLILGLREEEEKVPKDAFWQDSPLVGMQPYVKLG